MSYLGNNYSKADMHNIVGELGIKTAISQIPDLERYILLTFVMLIAVMIAYLWRHGWGRL